MTDETAYTPPRYGPGTRITAANSPTSIDPWPGRRTTRYCRWAAIRCSCIPLATPNGVKVTVMLEELLAQGHAGAEYDAWLINIAKAPSSDRASSA